MVKGTCCRARTFFDATYRQGLIYFFVLSTVLVLGNDTTLSAAPSSPEQPRALIQIPLESQETLENVRRSGLAALALEVSNGKPYVLAAVPLNDIDWDSGIEYSASVLDHDMTGANYYFVYPALGRPLPQWSKYGEIVLDEGVRLLMKTSPEKAESLAEIGAEIVHLSQTSITLDRQGISAVFDPIDTADALIQAIVEQVDSTAVYDYTADLTGEQAVTIGGDPYTIQTRYTYSGEPIDKATQYVGQHLQGLGLDVEYHVWNASTNPNVIGERLGPVSPDDIFIIGAHLDDLPSGSFAPGADDNASGSVAAMIAAEILTQYNWDCTLRFALWTGEEQGLLGSDAYARRSSTDGENIVGYLNLDMIAYNSGDPTEINLFAKSSIANSVDLAYLFEDVVDVYGLNLEPVIYIDDSLGERSDNGSFWDQGYASILAIEDYYGDFNPNYHTTADQLQYLDMDYYTDFVKAAVGTFAHMSDCLDPVPPLNVTISIDQTNVDLSWRHIANHAGYEVWRSSTPYFAADPLEAELVGEITPPALGEQIVWSDVDAIGEPNTFYLVQALDSSDSVSAISIYLGEFSYSLE